MTSASRPIGWLHVDPAFLATAIRRYVEQPEARAAIGTVDELARLQAEPAGPREERTLSGLSPS